MDKNKLDEYVEKMEIPKAEDVLPKECLKDNDETVSNEADNVVAIDKRRGLKRRWIMAAGGGLVAACAAVAVIVTTGGNNKINNDVVKNYDSTDKARIVGDSENEGSKDSSKKTYEDGVIGERKDTDRKGLKDYLGFTSEEVAEDGFKYGDSEKTFNKVDLAYGAEPAAEAETDYSDDISETPSGEIGDDIGFEGRTDIDYKAGTLTGGEIRDLKNWDNWTHVIDKDSLGVWNLTPAQRYCVYIHNNGGDDNTSVPVKNVTVKLMQSDKVVYEAMSDNDGYAYLFYNYSDDMQAQPDKILVEKADGSFDEYKLGGNEKADTVIDMTTDIENKGRNLDLMFVVDTTGSMGDELDYLKAEIQDVIERVQEETDIDTIRTSVNFYRDEGDEYVVKYFDFRDDAKEVAKIVAEQTCDGGGDYPEAVHTALDNAINEHSWGDSDTIKLMFIVLDAPPHDDSDVKAKLKELVELSAKKGIRIIPVAASGAEADTQQLLRSFAIMTGGTFLFLDDNSGVGYAHDVTVDENDYNSEYLNEMLIRVIGEYCGKTIESAPIEKPTQQPPRGQE